MSGLRINVGCGATPTPGWLNFDNSLTVRLAGLPLAGIVARTGLLPAPQRAFFQEAVAGKIRWANVVERIPLSDGSVEVLYSSHMLEHLENRQARSFLREAFRVLAPGGNIRIAVPDLRRLINQYVASGDADAFLDATLLAPPRLDSWRRKLRYLLVGHRDHAWMYDEASLCGLLRQAGFVEPRGLPPGQTSIKDAGALNLRERDHESIYVEAEKPSQ